MAHHRKHSFQSVASALKCKEQLALSTFRVNSNKAAVANEVGDSSSSGVSKHKLNKRFHKKLINGHPPARRQKEGPMSTDALTCSILRLTDSCCRFQYNSYRQIQSNPNCCTYFTRTHQTNENQTKTINYECNSNFVSVSFFLST